MIATEGRESTAARSITPGIGLDKARDRWFCLSVASMYRLRVYLDVSVSVCLYMYIYV